MTSFFKILIILHASFGGLALLSGTVAIIVKKGRSLHKKAGRFFFYSMIGCVISALWAALMPGHYSPFLIAVGVFSFYFVFTGFRVLRLKQKSVSIVGDKAAAYFMIIACIAMIAYPPILFGKLNLILAVFGAAGLFFAIQDILLFRHPEKFRDIWLRQHLTRMMGGFTAATTAFIVVSQILPELVSWLLPGIMGGALITFWSRSIERKKTVKS